MTRTDTHEREGSGRQMCAAVSEGLHEAVARVAQCRPDAVALIADRATTYSELNQTADAWAAGLIANGIGRNNVVPIMLPRSAQLVTALLAVLKTGAAYALLDPTWPTDRLREVVKQVDAPVLLANTGDDDLAPSVWVPPVEPVAVPAGFRPASVAGSDPCCVFFTSGTTGRPKAVLSPHRATARLFGPDGFACFGATTVMPLAAAIPWDAFSLELWSVLLNGGTSLVVTAPYLCVESLRRAVTRHGANTAWLTSSLFNMIVDEDLDAFSGLRQVMIGGERLAPGPVGRFLRHHPDITLINGYGPVESTVFATTHRVTPADCERPGGIPLGRPAPGTDVHVLDGTRHCAVGETGEICIAGDGLALCYLGDPALTDEKFVVVPIDGRPQRVYRSGDFGAWGPDGLLHFCGRADRQVKIRGHRIEPADVERQVEQLLPGVRSCRVIADRDGAGRAARLVAFCVPHQPGDPLTDALNVLRAGLLTHQRPAAVVSVAAFPTTPQGKIDEPALLATLPAASSCGIDDDGTATSCTEHQVMRAFALALGRATVPREVPFFELGGTSLDAGRVCNRLALRLDRQVPVSWLYRHPTAAALAGWLAATGGVTDGDPTPAGDEVPLSDMQLVYLTRHLVNPADRTGHCLLAWMIEGPLDHSALQSAIDSAHRRHEPLRAAYLPDPRPVALLIDVPPPPLEVFPEQPTVDAAAGALRDVLAEPLDPTAGDVWRTVVVPMAGATASVFGCAVHHIAFDGWSASVLARDLADGYDAALGRRASQAPAPPSLATMHRTYTQRLAHSRSPGVHHELRGVPELVWPPGRTATRAGQPGCIAEPLCPAAVAAVDAAAADLGVSRFVVLLSECAASLSAVTGQRDFTVGVPVRQRAGAGLEHSLGCHLNILCVRLSGEALDGGAAAIGATGVQLNRAFATQDIPFAQVVRDVAPPGTGRPPLFQTLFVLQDNPVPRLRIGGLRTRFLRQPYLDLPLELHVELWPDDHGGLLLEIWFRREVVPESVARKVAGQFARRVNSLPTGAAR
ncbi:MAG TPA: amino acid adenylation domain-containing protein [Mycobacterium sp.]|nr:amino acid adenylation domain-containing protein [Mycobacterium sp.]